MNRYFKFLIWPIAAAPLLYLAANWSRLPETIAMHFDLEGNPDRYGDKKELLIMTIVLSAMSAGIYFLLSNIYRIDPKKAAAENKDRLKRMGFILGVFMSAITCFIIYSSVKGGFEGSIKYVFAAIGVLYAILGNYMHTIKPNYFVGFRLPWTLNSEENWRKTHLLGGKLWFVGGLVIAIVCLAVPNFVSAIAFFILTAIMVFIPIIYSYRLFQAEKQAKGETNQN